MVLRATECGLSDAVEINIKKVLLKYKPSLILALVFERTLERRKRWNIKKSVGTEVQRFDGIAMRKGTLIIKSE